MNFRRIAKVAFIVAAIVVVIAFLNQRACNYYIYKYVNDDMKFEASILDVDKNFTFPPGFPPDPGKEGKRTIEGIDSDHDGVRDDVQRWIYALHPNEPAKVNALRQKARFYQHSLHPEFGPEVRKKNIVIMDRAIQCMSESFDDTMQGYTEGRYLKAKTLNSYERTMRYLENDREITSKEMSGEHPDHPNPCDNR